MQKVAASEPPKIWVIEVPGTCSRKSCPGEGQNNNSAQYWPSCERGAKFWNVRSRPGRVALGGGHSEQRQHFRLLSLVKQNIENFGVYQMSKFAFCLIFIYFYSFSWKSNFECRDGHRPCYVSDQLLFIFSTFFKDLGYCKTNILILAGVLKQKSCLLNRCLGKVILDAQQGSKSWNVMRSILLYFPW